MDAQFFLIVLLFSPLIGFLINGFRYRHHSANVAGIIATAAAGLSFLAALALVFQLVNFAADSQAGTSAVHRRLAVDLFQWLDVGLLKVSASFVIDPISAIMILVVTGVGSLIHLFSIGYMHHDAGAAKYFAYLNLFLFNMLVLVTGESLPVMFVGWEGVGLCSYLLIGFWFTDEQKAAAGMKAFITNRIGDAAFVLGMFILFFAIGSLSFQTLNEGARRFADEAPLGWLHPITLATLFLFIGATGKSAQIPLYVWLPDAMAGPTPVSALIHAATMVTAGVYMIVRLNALFMMAPLTMMIIAIVGALTAVMAASIGLTQWDIKKVLAYSTVSQLGYMFLACGVGAFSAAMFHLMTHAFFKALMFLGSGSVIHAMHEEQDIRKMGGLRKALPITHATFVLGWLAIIGIPPFAGFFSKDEILWKTFSSPLGHPLLWVVGAAGAMMTAFYMTRLVALTFWGESRVPKGVHPHESPPTMTIPLGVLGVLSVVGGWLGIPHLIGSAMPFHTDNILESFLAHSIVPLPGGESSDSSLEVGLMLTSVVLASAMAGLAFLFYAKKSTAPARIAEALGGFYRLVYNKYFVDEAYFRALINPLMRASQKLWYYVDVSLIDRTTYVLSDTIRGGGSFVRSLQSGNLQQYALYIGLGVVTVLSIILVRG
ncbi:MAG: NADH-quinone oxidoreductase subunit L [Bdellovibrio sp.]|nr:MAG: NADH-quinone oxidoreductase subunit L [Bdellovibrio sp.]